MPILRDNHPRHLVLAIRGLTTSRAGLIVPPCLFWFAKNSSRLAYGVFAAGLAFGLAFGLAAGLLAGLAFGLAAGAGVIGLTGVPP